ncbi:hypothetical protein MBLNU459_g1371t1 [Dothideomycetes sp. NU459]
MPGASLWLVPPRSSPFCQLLQTLISTAVPPHFAGAATHDFVPHVTLTSGIERAAYGSDAQAWLAGLGLPDKDEPTVALESLEAGAQFVKKLTLGAAKTASLVRLAAACRGGAVLRGGGDDDDDDGAAAAAAAAAARSWAEEDYLPHLSLMYADLPVSDVQERLSLLEDQIRKAARSLEAGDGGEVCQGGSIVLVDTSKPIAEWVPIAERHLPHLSWSWPWSRPPSDADLHHVH